MLSTLISMGLGAVSIVAVDKGYDLLRKRQNARMDFNFERKEEETELESELREKCDALAEKLWCQWSSEDA